MKRQTIATAVLAAAVLFGAAARADTIVQSGEIQQLGETIIILDQFDDMGGARELNFVQIDLYSYMHGGFTTSGNGVPVHIHAEFNQEYFRDTQLLAGTHCILNHTDPNFAQGAYTFWIPDSDQVVIHQTPHLAPWIGTGQITITSMGDFWWSADPPEGLIDFGANLHADYTFTYDYTALSCPGDVDGNGVVDVVDLLAVLSAWGSAGGPEDVNGDGLVDVLDLLIVLSAWGPC